MLVQFPRAGTQLDPWPSAAPPRAGDMDRQGLQSSRGNKLPPGVGCLVKSTRLRVDKGHSQTRRDSQMASHLSSAPGGRVPPTQTQQREGVRESRVWGEGWA